MVRLLLLSPPPPKKMKKNPEFMGYAGKRGRSNICIYLWRKERFEHLVKILGNRD